MQKNGVRIYNSKAVKAPKKEAVATVKKLILEFNLTKGDIRGKAWKHLEA
jgi:hypothetical protein